MKKRKAKAKKETNPPSSTVPGPQRPADGTSALMPDIKITVAIATLPLMNMINDRFNVKLIFSLSKVRK